MLLKEGPQQALPCGGMPLIAVIGLGSVGTVLGGHLAAAGCPVTVAREEVPALSVERHGETYHGPVSTNRGPADWVLLATKAHQTASAAGALQQYVGPRTIVAVCQNGIEHEGRVRPLCPAAEILPVLVYANGERLSPGMVRHIPAQPDALVPDTPGGRAFAALFTTTPFTIRTEPDFLSATWRKLLLNAVSNPLTALTGRPLEVLREPAVSALALDLLAEGAAVGRAAGANLPPDTPRQVLDRLLAYAPTVGTSMLQDRLAGRPLEHDAITGAIVRAGERHGVAAPLHRALDALLVTINR